MTTLDLGFDLAQRRDARLLRGLLLGLAASIMEAAPWLLLALVFRDAAAEQAEPWRVMAYAGIGLTALLIGWLCRAQALLDNFTASYGLVAEARLNLTDHLARLPLGRVLRQRAAVLADLVTGQFALYQDIIVHVWGIGVAQVALPPLLWAILAWLDLRLALVLLAFLPFAALAVPWSHRLLDRAAEQVIAAKDRMTASVVELMDGARELRLFDPEGRRRAAADAALAAMERESRAVELAPAPALLAYGFVLATGLAMMTVAGAWLWSKGRLDAVTLLVALPVAARCMGAVTEFGTLLTELRVARLVLARIREVAQEPALPQPVTPRRPADAGFVLRDVGFSQDGIPVLRGIDAVLPAGSVTALVGPSGAGKSTLALLLARLWDVESGSISLGGVDLREIDSATLNASIAMVLQDVVLFDLTVADNIRLGRADASAEEVIAAARAAQIHDRIMALPEGYATRLADEGAALSGGERQRLAIARALLKNAPVLILDEATASLDLDNEALIQQALAAVCEGRTVVAIAHRLWTVRDADQILVLDQGRIVERGRHDALLATGGLYHRLWQAQAAARDWQLIPEARKPVS